MKSKTLTSGYQRPETIEISFIELGVLCASQTVGIESIVEDNESLTF